MIHRFFERVQRKIHSLHDRIAPRAIVLMYHRVAEAAVDPWDMCVSPKHFDEHMAMLREEGYTPLSLRDLKHDLANNAVNRRSVIITFDDGYADNLLQAKPVLEHYNIPATIFITTSIILSEQDFWWDTLEQLLLYPGTLPETLYLEIEGRPHSWDLNGAARYTEQAFQQHRSWKACFDPPTTRQSLFLELWNLLHLISPAEKRHVLSDLKAQVEQPLREDLAYCSLSEVELLTLDSSPVINIGAHTVNHLPLAEVDPPAQQKEVCQSKLQLESLLNHSVTDFSYPHGSFNNNTGAVIRDAGFSCACSSTPGRVRPSTDPYHIPRTVIPNWTGVEFARQLKQVPS